MKDLPRLWCPNLSSEAAFLTAEQIHYLKKVLRLGPGAEVIVLDGRGKAWRATWQGELAHFSELLPQIQIEPPHPIYLGAAVLKGEAMDWSIQKATELGATTLQPLLTDYTQLVPSPQKLERWRRIMAESCEQCERLFLPQLLSAGKLAELTNLPDLRLVALERPSGANRPRFVPPIWGKQGLLTAIPPQPIALLVGPEGGWSPAEVTFLLAQGWQAVSLGPRILRAETAVCSLLSQVTAWMEDPP
jgi:16S rRNA (uracil1498-N3)-methyltransferase